MVDANTKTDQTCIFYQQVWETMTLNSGYGNLPRGLETVYGGAMFWWSNIDKMELIMYIEHSQKYSICTNCIYNDIPQGLFK